MTTHTPTPAKEAVLTDEEIINVLRRLAVRPGDHDFNLGQCIARAIESALLSKLRAPVADEPTKSRPPMCRIAGVSEDVLRRGALAAVRAADGYTPHHDEPHQTGVGEWCAPGPAAEQRQAWLLRFADAERGDCVYYDEQEARRAFAQSEGRGWNCYLFEYARRAAQASASVAGEAQLLGYVSDRTLSDLRFPFTPYRDVPVWRAHDEFKDKRPPGLTAIYTAPQASEAVRDAALRQALQSALAVLDRVALEIVLDDGIPAHGLVQAQKDARAALSAQTGRAEGAHPAQQGRRRG